MISSVAVRVPVARGVNLTSIVQCEPAATVPPQPLVAVKSPWSAPAKVTVKVKAVDRLLVSVTALAALFVPTA